MKRTGALWRSRSRCAVAERKEGGDWMCLDAGMWLCYGWLCVSAFASEQYIHISPADRYLSDSGTRHVDDTRAECKWR